MADIRLEGFDALIKGLGKAEELFLPLASRAMVQSLTAIYEEISPYPPQPDRMRSGHLNTYVRGEGRYPASAFKPDAAQPGGFKTKRVKSTQIKRTSQQMDRRWRMKVVTTARKITGILWNTASYSGYVSGPKNGDPHQVSFHTKTGWPNKDDAIAAATPLIMQSLNTAVDQFIGKLKGGA